MSSQRKPTIVFCHGIWADGSCFSKVIPALQADGHEVIAVQYGLDSFEEDVATVKRTLNRVGSPVILVRPFLRRRYHYGLGRRSSRGWPRLHRSGCPRCRRDRSGSARRYPSDIFTRVKVADGRAWMLPNGTEFFAGDLSQEEQ